MKVKHLIISLFIIPLIPTTGTTCTSFYIDHYKKPVFGQNLDYPSGDGLIVINKKGYYKTAMTDPDKSLNPIRWKSLYGSVTFNKYGCDWPWGGINEVGLTIGTMSLQQSHYPAVDSRPSIFLPQWLQYQLDTHRTVKEVVASNLHLRIRQIRKEQGSHFFISDQSGDSAVIEFIDGKFVSYYKKSLPIKVLTNDPYEYSLNVAKQFNCFGGKYPIPKGNLSYIRFVKAASMLQKYNLYESITIIDDAFNILENVAYGDHRTIQTQWSVVYDIQNRLIYFRTKKNREIRFLDMKAINFTCSTPVKMMNINNPISGDITLKFKAYTYQINKSPFEKAFRNNPLKVKISNAKLERISRYPETFICHE